MCYQCNNLLLSNACQLMPASNFELVEHLPKNQKKKKYSFNGSPKDWIYQVLLI
jgi:hypothetical protein